MGADVIATLALWKRNKTGALKPRLPRLTVLLLGLWSPRYHSPSWLGCVRHDARLHGSMASLLCVCVARSAGHQRGMRRHDSYRFGWPEPARHEDMYI